MDKMRKAQDLIDRASVKPQYDAIVIHPYYSKLLDDVDKLNCRVIYSALITKKIQTKFPRCNKKKIRVTKKFKKKYSADVPDDKVYFINSRIRERLGK
jgi:hypothetical protein